MPSLSSFPQSVQDEVAARMAEAVRNGEVLFPDDSPLVRYLRRGALRPEKDRVWYEVRFDGRTVFVGNMTLGLVDEPWRHLVIWGGMLPLVRTIVRNRRLDLTQLRFSGGWTSNAVYNFGFVGDDRQKTVLCSVFDQLEVNEPGQGGGFAYCHTIPNDWECM